MSTTARAVLFFVVLVAAWLAAYASGAYPWLGHASWTRRSTTLGGLTIAGEERLGWQSGLDDFLFVRGQEVVIAYEADIRAGSLWFHVFRPLDGLLGDGSTHYVTKSGRGEWTMPVEETGYYHVNIEPTVVRGAGKGWDLSYSVSWGARPAIGR
jgi:hypothetical protein